MFECGVIKAKVKAACVCGGPTQVRMLDVTLCHAMGAAGLGAFAACAEANLRAILT